MEPLTDDRQFLLGLGMMAADKHSGLSIMDRMMALELVVEEEVPESWRPRIQAYLEERQAQKESTP